MATGDPRLVGLPSEFPVSLKIGEVQVGNSLFHCSACSKLFQSFQRKARQTQFCNPHAKKKKIVVTGNKSGRNGSVFPSQIQVNRVSVTTHECLLISWGQPLIWAKTTYKGLWHCWLLCRPLPQLLHGEPECK